MNPKEEALQQRMQVLRGQYAETLPQKIEELETLWRQIVSGNQSHRLYETLIHKAHNLTGSGSIYGFPEISRLAAELELLLAELQRLPPAPPSPGEQAKVEELLHSLRLAIGEPA